MVIDNVNNLDRLTLQVEVRGLAEMSDDAQTRLSKGIVTGVKTSVGVTPKIELHAPYALPRRRAARARPPAIASTTEGAADGPSMTALAGFLEDAGVAQWGVAACPDEPWPYAPPLPRAVSIGIALTPRRSGRSQAGPTAAYFAEYQRVNAALWAAAQRLAALLRVARRDGRAPPAHGRRQVRQGHDRRRRLRPQDGGDAGGARLDRQDGDLRLAASRAVGAPGDRVHRRRSAGRGADHGGRLRRVPALRRCLPGRRGARRALAGGHAARGAPRRGRVHGRERAPRWSGRRLCGICVAVCPFGRRLLATEGAKPDPAPFPTTTR